MVSRIDVGVASVPSSFLDQVQRNPPQVPVRATRESDVAYYDGYMSEDAVGMYQQTVLEAPAMSRE